MAARPGSTPASSSSKVPCAALGRSAIGGTRNDQGLHREADALGCHVRLGTLFNLVPESLALGIRHPPQLVEQRVGRRRADFEIAIERRQIDIEANRRLAYIDRAGFAKDGGELSRRRMPERTRSIRIWGRPVDMAIKHIQ